ncbi:MAG TPA: ABC transporter ATP-binding protein [Candidatus Paceibacterota bacterium]|nr:ABC transporter ATP-binding protein [Candidatus Pacearchaeota archaeon]HRZ50377.1 ABC transporter ATP-binding protein [Candidatus Paceibacterota bacterium]HSA36098.1 ABC transporter ATP-binding protein [Candidatus Paceibacterota bacterium]
MIDIKNLTKIVRSGASKLAILDSVTLTVESGEFLSIIGRSGAGKSTLLYAASLLDPDFQGDVYIDGVKVSGLADRKRVEYRLNNLGFIFQEYALLPELTAVENVVLPFLMRGVASKNAYLKAEEALSQVGLEKKIKNLPSTLSGGEQQRVAIARAIAGNPKILFADEPTANLDSLRACEIMEIFLRLNRNGQTIVLVTHEADLANMTHRIVEMKDGKILSDKRIDSPTVNLCAKHRVL